MIGISSHFTMHQLVYSFQSFSSLLSVNFFLLKLFMFGYTEFPKKDASFLKIKNIPDLLSDDKEGKIM